MEQKTILFAIAAASLLLLAGCAKEGGPVDNLELKAMCEQTGGAYHSGRVAGRNVIGAIAPSCECQEGKDYDSKYGCILPETLATAQLCESSGGRYNYCTMEACISSCICNPGEEFDSEKGCVAKSEQSLCESTGGQYKEWPCTPCAPGVACPPCGLGCFCGEGFSFDSQLGCVAPVEPDGGIGNSPPPPPE